MTRPQVAWAEVTIDCQDPARVARFWGGLLSVDPHAESDGWFRIGPLMAGGPVINFQPVPEPKVGKTRIHLDIWVDDLDAAASLVESLGGHRVGGLAGADDEVGAVMTDAEGNEFCLVALRE